MVIDFHELTDLSRISCDYNLAQLQPGPLCTSSGAPWSAPPPTRILENCQSFWPVHWQIHSGDPGVNPMGCILDIPSIIFLKLTKTSHDHPVSLYLLIATCNIRGKSRISREGGASKLIILQNFLKTEKKLDRGGVHRKIYQVDLPPCSEDSSFTELNCSCTY